MEELTELILKFTKISPKPEESEKYLACAARILDIWVSLKRIIEIDLTKEEQEEIMKMYERELKKHISKFE